MAKPTKYAPHICILATISAVLGIVFGLVFSQPVIIVIFLFPAAIYEAYRTEGKTTKAASLLLVFILFLELIFYFLE